MRALGQCQNNACPGKLQNKLPNMKRTQGVDLEIYTTLSIQNIYITTDTNGTTSLTYVVDTSC